MRSKALFILLFVFNFVAAQVEITINDSDDTSKIKNFTFTQFEISIPLRGNQTYGEVDENGNRSEYMFLPDGISAKFGYGIHHNEWIGISATSGFDWYGTKKLVAVPLFVNFRLSPRITDETRITLQYGVGKSFAVGRGDLMGNYQKISLGLENADGICLFLEINNHGYKIRNSIDEVYSINIGVLFIPF